MSFSSQTLYNSSQYFDYYSYAKNQKISLNLQILCLYFVSIYSLKYFQIFSKSNLMINAFKKSYKEYMLLSMIIIVCFLGLSLVTYYVYSQYIKEYSNYIDSILINLKIFIFSEDVIISELLLSYSKPLSLLIFILFILAIRYFLLFLFFPIMMENYRMESENFATRLEDDISDFTFKDSKYFIK